MSNHTGSPEAPKPEAADLESHLRNLILAPGGPPQEAQAPNKGQPSKPGRKRLNQAQRRQMNSQLSIPIDPRPQASNAPHNQFGSHGHQTWGSQPFQRHSYNNSQPRFSAQNNRPTSSYKQSSWDNNQHQPSYQDGQAMPPPGFHHNAHLHQNRRGGGPSYGYNYIRHNSFDPEEVAAQSSLLDRLAFQVVANSEIERSEIAEKEDFRCRLEGLSREAIFLHEQEKGMEPAFHHLSIQLKCFGSLSSGFATKASDMDLGLLSPHSLQPPDAPGSPIPRVLEKAFLDAGLGARLLTRTRIPIIKICQNPPEKLRQDLLDERYKWENGLDGEHQETHDDQVHDEAKATTLAQTPSEDASIPAPGSMAPSVEPTVSELGGAAASFHIDQGPKNSLSSYYGLAKRILRRAGGRDVTVSNIHDFSEHEWTILNRVGYAFIAGLAEKKLQERLLRSPSLRSVPGDNMLVGRSLAAVFTQAEGELLLQSWREAGFQERSQIQQNYAEQLATSWDELQQRTDFAVDPIGFGRELQMCMDRFKKLSSVQLVSLEQGQHETPALYCHRFSGIIRSIRSPHGVESLDWQSMMASKYITGIHQPEMREAVKTYWDTSGTLPFKAVARRHESLHLAWELERALDKDLYENAHIQDIRDYIKLLRSPIQTAPSRVSNVDFVIPLTPETLALVNRIRELPDPHKMAPNQPKDRYRDRLEFPESGVGVQCDINFSAHLGLQNTLLLRCYSHTDSRVRPMVLFIKHWAKMRGINSGYRGTLSSYGYVLMVLHYLVNVAQPFVCPNLQQLATPPPPNLSHAEIEQTVSCRGHNVQFWRNEEEILRLARANQLNHNTNSIGHLLRGFFEYFAQGGVLSSNGKGFDWGRDVISLRTIGGLLSKQEKGWTGAKTVLEVQGTSSNPAPPANASTSPILTNVVPVLLGEAKSMPNAKCGEVKEVRHRYLFAIEDPFELDHNVARTVTHNGIVSIRDEFRRAWRIIKSAGGEGVTQEDLLRDVSEEQEQAGPFSQALDSIHGL